MYREYDQKYLKNDMQFFEKLWLNELSYLVKNNMKKIILAILFINLFLINNAF